MEKGKAVQMGRKGYERWWLYLAGGPPSLSLRSTSFPPLPPLLTAGAREDWVPLLASSSPVPRDGGDFSFALCWLLSLLNKEISSQHCRLLFGHNPVLGRDNIRHIPLPPLSAFP